MMRRAATLLALAAGVALASLAYDARSAEPVARIGWLGLDSAMQAGRYAAFQRGMRDLGYVEGRNVQFVYRSADGDFERLSALAKELVAAHVDLIVAASPAGVRAAQQATRTVPIVMTVHEPVRTGFVQSLAHPGGNTTGIAFQDDALNTKRIDLFRQLVPQLRRLAILWNGTAGTDPQGVKDAEAAAKAMGLDVLSLEVSQPDDFARQIGAAKAWGAQGIDQLASPFITKNRKVLLELLATNRLPAACEMRMYVDEGCLMTYSANLDAIFYRLAYFADRVLKGANPGDLAIEQPREFEFVINMKTAQALGLTVSPMLRYQMTDSIPVKQDRGG